jgi:hypothetical protein
MTSESQTPEYKKGYALGKKSADKALLSEVTELRRKVLDLSTEKRERVYLGCLDAVLRNCSGWLVGGEKINDAKGYCKLAKIFADNSIEVLK